MWITDETPIKDIIAEHDAQVEAAFNAAMNYDFAAVREALEAAEIAIRHLRLLREWDGVPMTEETLMRRARDRRLRCQPDYIPF